MNQTNKNNNYKLSPNNLMKLIILNQVNKINLKIFNCKFKTQKNFNKFL